MKTVKPDEISANLGAIIADRRHQLGISQQAMSAAAGCTRPYVSAMEHGKTNISILLLLTISKVLQRPAHLLIHEAEHYIDPIVARSSRQSSIVHFNESNFLGDLGSILADRRVRLGLSQGDLATAAGLNRTHISEVERGHVNLRVTTLHRIARALNTRAAVVLQECL